MKLLRDKKSKLLNVANEFHAQVMKGSDLLHECINDLTEGKLNKEKLKGVIECEHNADIAKENYINILYEDKRALPFLVEDRYRLIKYLDLVSDNSEELARGLLVFPFDFYDDIKGDMKKLNDTYEETIKLLIEMIRLMETDFKTAYQKSFDIETLKRNGRKSKFQILEVIYKKSEEKSLRIYLTSKICIKLFDMIERAEEISDFLRSLIVKYPSK
jgi:predicted phosphate transport protein (TIGR00153 family)